MIGFAVMKLPRGLNAAYERSPLVQQNLDEFRSLGGAFKLNDPRCIPRNRALSSI